MKGSYSTMQTLSAEFLQTPPSAPRGASQPGSRVQALQDDIMAGEAGNNDDLNATGKDNEPSVVTSVSPRPLAPNPQTRIPDTNPLLPYPRIPSPKPSILNQVVSSFLEALNTTDAVSEDVHPTPKTLELFWSSVAAIVGPFPTSSFGVFGR